MQVGNVRHPNQIHRRQFIGLSLTGIAGVLAPWSSFPAMDRVTPIKAIAFDAFPIFDPRPIATLTEKMFPGKGTQLINSWRTKQFEYTWLYTAAGKYRDFWEVTADALIFAGNQSGITISTSDKDQLMEQYLVLNVWPDVLPALDILKQHSIRLAFLSNFTGEMLRSCIRHSRLENYFEQVISTDSVKSYKPNPSAYQAGIDQLQLKKEEILFAAFAGWDAMGSKWFGYPTFWVNRMGASPEELHAVPEGMGKDLTDLIKFVIR